MRERFDVGSGLVAIGAVLLLVSLFMDFYEPGGDAWATFETLDLVLAGAAIAALAGLLPRFEALGRRVPLICAVALVIVAVQLVSPPPAARGHDIAAGGWLALAATALMAIGAALAAASISVTVDVRERERRRRTAAIDARERIVDHAAAVEESDPADLEPSSVAARAAARRAGRRAVVSAPPARRAPEPEPVEEPETADAPDEPVEEPETADAPGESPVADDPQRTQAMDPIDRDGTA